MRKKRREIRCSLVGLVMVSLVVGTTIGCASGPDERASNDRESQTVMGSPPSEDSEDYEFAAPPRHPGDHGEVQTRGSGQESAEREPDVIYRSEIEELKNYGPSVVLKHVDTEASHEDGSFVGFQIVDVSEAAHSIIAPHLRVGDVVTHINLVRLQRPDDYVEAWNTLDDVQEIRIDFQRDGKEKQAVWRVQ